jgi:hypothetical protein
MDLPLGKGLLTTRGVREGGKIPQNPSLTRRVGIKAASRHAASRDVPRLILRPSLTRRVIPSLAYASGYDGCYASLNARITQRFPLLKPDYRGCDRGFGGRFLVLWPLGFCCLDSALELL